MIVHRLKDWISRVVAVLAAALRSPSTGRRSATLGLSQRPFAAIGIAYPHGSGLATSHWMADARRLRARPVPRPALPAPAREQLRQIFRDPRWTVAYNAAPAVRPPRTPLTGTPQPTQPSSEPAAGRPRTSQGPSSAADGQGLHERRRLVYVRELVRRGIYNEGFDPSRLPEQYRPKPPRPGALPPDQPSA